MANVSRRITARDRGWAGVESLRVFGPFRGITADGLCASLSRLHAQDPAMAALCRIDQAAMRWVPLSGADFAVYRHRLVADAGGTGDPADADTVTRLLIDEPLDERPMLLVVRGGYIGLKLSHVVGDGRVVNALLPELLHATAADRPPRPPFPAATRLPAVRAIARHFSRHPTGLAAAVRREQPPGPPPGEPTVDWKPAVEYCSVRSATALRAARAWRDAHAPGVSAASVLFAATTAALARCGLDPKPGMVVLVDARRYLPPGATVDGNFSWGQYLRPADPADPRQVYAALGGELAGGRPAMMIGLRAARLTLSRAAAAPHAAPRTVPARPRPALTLTHIGRLDPYRDLPWTGPAEEWRNISVPTVSGPEAITVSFSELGSTLYVNASFHGSTFDPAPVRRAVELICADPAGLIAA